MQGDLKRTYTRSYRISVFKRKMKKRALAPERRMVELGAADAEVDTTRCSSSQSGSGTKEDEAPVACEKDGSSKMDLADGMCRIVEVHQSMVACEEEVMSATPVVVNSAKHDLGVPENISNAVGGMIRDGHGEKNAGIVEKMHAAEDPLRLSLHHNSDVLPVHPQTSSFDPGAVRSGPHIKRSRTLSADCSMHSETIFQDESEKLPGGTESPGCFTAHCTADNPKGVEGCLHLLALQDCFSPMQRNCEHVPSGCLKTPTKIFFLTDDGNGSSTAVVKESTADEIENTNNSRIGYFEGIKMSIANLKSDTYSMSQSLEDIRICRLDLQKTCNGLLAHHCSMLEMSKNFGKEQAVALEECENRLGQINTEKDSVVAMHLASLFSRTRQLLDSINLDAISHGIANLDVLADNAAKMRSENESRNGIVRVLEEDLQSVTVKANIQEEQIEYLMKQVGILKKSNRALEFSLSLVATSSIALSKYISDAEANYNRVKDLFSTIHSQSCSKAEELLVDLRAVRDKVESLMSEIDIGACVSSIRESLRNSLKRTADAYESQFEALRASNLDLEKRAQELNREVFELRDRNASMSESSKYMEEEIELKNTYAKEMESTLDELMRSNKFYEDQLIKSDDALRSLKERQIKSSMGFASEVEKMRKAHLKESGMLKLRIEELELELAGKTIKTS